MFSYFPTILWYVILNLTDENHLSHIVRVATSDLLVLHKARSETVPPGWRLKVPQFRCNGSKNSFVPCAVNLLNLHM